MLSRNHLNLLLAQMLKNKSVLLDATRKLSGEHLVKPEVGGTQAQALMFDVIKDYYTEHDASPDTAALLVEIQTVLERMLEDKTQIPTFLAEIDIVDRLSTKVDARSIPLVTTTIKELVDICVVTPNVQELANSVVFETDPSKSLDTMLERLSEIKKMQSNVAEEASANIFEIQTEDGERQQTGISWFDSRLGKGKGPVLGSVIGILAGQGCGKTTNGVEFCVARALGGQHSLLVLAEDGITARVQLNILARTTGIAVSQLETFNWRDTESFKSFVKAAGLDYDLIMMKRESVGKYFRVLDLVKNEGGMEEVEAMVASLADRGHKPQAVYIDWAGIMAERAMSVGFKGRKYDQKHQILKSLSFAAADIATKYNNHVFYSHQLMGKLVKSSLSRPATHNDAEDCSGWSQPFKYCFTISTRDPKTGLQLISISKSRNDPPDQRVVVKLDGDYATFRDLSDRYELGGKTFRKKGKAQDDNAMPKERKSFEPE